MTTTTTNAWPVIHYTRLNNERVRELREARGWSHEEVARRVRALDASDDPEDEPGTTAYHIREWETDVPHGDIHVDGLRVDWSPVGADIKEGAACRFLLTRGSAPQELARVFGVPVASLVETARYTVMEDRGF